jgi:UPF0271 protein
VSILDASAFYAGIPFLSGSQWFTTPLVYDEIQHIKKSHGAVDALIDARNLVILQPDDSSLRTVKQAAKESGDLTKLSEADISVLALAYELKKNLITDDYKIANVASYLQIVVRTISVAGITSTRRWIAICLTCEKSYPPELTECKNCGNRLRYKYKKK